MFAGGWVRVCRCARASKCVCGVCACTCTCVGLCVREREYGGVCASGRAKGQAGVRVHAEASVREGLAGACGCKHTRA